MRIGVVCVIKESWGGSEELWAAMAHEAIAQGHQVIVSAYNCGNIHPKMQALIEKGLILKYRRGYVKPGLPAWKRVLKKLRIIALNKLNNPFATFFSSTPGIILYNGTSYTCLEDKQFFSTAITKKIPYCYLSHIAADYYRPVGLGDIPFIATAFNNAKFNFFVAERTIKITERQIASVIPNKNIVRNPVNLKDTSPVSYPLLNDTIQFATVGLLVAAHKGQDILFEVLSSPTWKSRNWHLNIYGSGPDKNYLEQLTLMYDINKRVTFHGKVSDIRMIWEKNHLLIMPSLMEGMPLAVVEAMLCARPCVATDVGDHALWIEENEQGFIAEAPSPYAIAKTMEKAWGSRYSWEQAGKNAHEKAMSLFDREPGKKLLSFLINN